MFIAKKLKKENICEYLLYMWQVENLIRAFKLDMNQVNLQIISQYPVSEQEKREMYDWYESLIEMMRMENRQENGHIQLNTNIIIELNDFHQVLLKSGKVPAYNSKFYHVLPFISQLKLKQDNGSLSDIETCFNLQYGIMVLKMKKAEISPETLDAQNEISKFMILLARNYKQYKEGELEIED
jgi:Domain of unknown function (DUF4924)